MDADDSKGVRPTRPFLEETYSAVSRSAMVFLHSDPRHRQTVALFLCKIILRRRFEFSIQVHHSLSHRQMNNRMKISAVLVLMKESHGINEFSLLKNRGAARSSDMR